MAKIQLQNVSLTYKSNRQEHNAISNVNMNIQKGEFVSIIGPSGCGKSTLLSLFAGLNFPTDGCILLDDQKITKPGPERGVVFQHYSLFPWMTAKKNLMFGLKQTNKGMSRHDIAKIADEYLNLVGLMEFSNKYPSELSGGMQQRVAIARAFAMNPKILLLDEPFGAVDAKNRVMLQELLLELWQNGKEKKTVLLVTHDIDEAILLSDRIIMMSAGPGTIKMELEVGFSRPRTRTELVQTEQYTKLRNKLVSLFYDNVLQNIGGAEVFL
jgi:NitT/TauT family transport system ATP-binding protein